jgi:hypothetical protein
MEEWAPWGAGAVLALPILAFRYPPMGDLAFHESLVSILRHFGDPRYFPEGLYRRNLGEPNQLFHAAAWALAWVFPTDTACKIVVAASVLGVSVGAGRLASHVGTTRWRAMLVAPLGLGWMFRWGLVANLVGFALWLFALPALDRLAKKPSPIRALHATLLTGLLYLGHESSMVIYAIASGVLALQTPRRLSAFMWVSCPGAVAVALATISAIRSEPLKAASIRAVASETLPLAEKVSTLPGALFSLHEASLPFLIASTAALVGLALRPRLPGADPLVPAERGWLARACCARFEILAVVLLGLYFAMPLTFSGSTLIYQRFLAPSFALVALSAARRSTAAWAPLLVAFPLAMLALMLDSFVEQDTSYRALDRILARMADGSAVAQLDLTPHPPGIFAPVLGPPARALAVHGGRLLFSFTDAPALPVSVPLQFQWNEPVLRLSSAPYAFLPEHDLRRFRYIVAQLTEPRLRSPIVQAFAPEATLVTEAGPWLLFESNLPLAPLTESDEPLPSPLPTSLGQRVQAVLRAGSTPVSDPRE